MNNFEYISRGRVYKVNHFRTIHDTKSMDKDFRFRRPRFKCCTYSTCTEFTRRSVES